ncbi:MAG TPA: chromosome segregation protein SMC [Acidimicrobiales bacterium]|nr:chromosome segregation protein SMC [Acidimicrobiales bacterium]
MFLRSLGMKGFKSFADPTVLEFEPGVTVVVGPNGSGKSNVVDAVTWVLGAQGPRSLRSATMADVIFAGSSSRPPLGRAEVTLTIDNTSGRLPLDMAEVTITRTLFRSGESEYAINGAPCRLLDIQELLSDTGVGRQQHMIIGQGQLDTVLNARPEDRRAIIEDAAGVRKHRQRRERAERRLAVTQENLERLGDLVREVRRQIRPLERQATAARSHASLAAELSELRQHLAGVELAELAERGRVTSGSLSALRDEETELGATLVELDRAASAAAAELASRREEDLAAALGRVRALLERTRGTKQVLDERRRSLAVSLDAAADVDVVSTLEAEAARLGAEMAATESESVAMSPEVEALAGAEAELAADERAHREEWGDHGDVGAAEEALEVTRARVEVLRRTGDQAQAGLRSLERRIAGLSNRATELAEAIEALDGGRGSLTERGAQLESAAARAEAATADARSEADAAERALAQAEEERHRSAARAEALSRALQELQGSGGREMLSGGEGVVGALVELVEIDPGFESAFEAAVGASMAAVVVEGRRAAKNALGRLRSQGTAGAVLPAPEGPTAWPGLPDVPSGAEPLRPHVRTRRAAGGPLDSVLDAVLGSAVAVDGWERAIDLALDRPELVVVTTEGDRFARSGWRARSSSRLVTVAAVEDAESRAVLAAAEAGAAADELEGVRAALEEARTAAVGATRQLDRHLAETAALEAERSRMLKDRVRLETELDDVRRTQNEVAESAATEARVLAEHEGSLPGLEAAFASAAQRAADALVGRGALERRRAELADARQRTELVAAGLAERQRVLAARLAEVERRLSGHGAEREAAAGRRLRIEADVRAVDRLSGVVAQERARLDEVQRALEADYRHQIAAVRAGGERLESLHRDRSGIERRLGEVRDQARVLDHEAAEVDVRTESLTEMVRQQFGATPAEVIAVRCPELPAGTSAAEHAEQLGAKLARLGPINPLALEELSTLEERHRELETQTDDVRSARRELQEVVRTLDREIAETFATAVADVNEHFSTLVSTLFPGGTGRLVLTEPEDLLNTGVDIEIRPAGRNVRRVSLLSGGERSLSALAFLFAVFKSRPSPFYLMDEVEAALDDVNLHRFLDMVHEFRDEAQLIIVSHQKRTMEAADALYGVTMAPGGSSQVVSQRVEERTERTERAAS